MYIMIFRRVCNIYNICTPWQYCQDKMFKTCYLALFLFLAVLIILREEVFKKRERQIKFHELAEKPWFLVLFILVRWSLTLPQCSWIPLKSSLSTWSSPVSSPSSLQSPLALCSVLFVQCVLCQVSEGVVQLAVFHNYSLTGILSIF